MQQLDISQIQSQQPLCYRRYRLQILTPCMDTCADSAPEAAVNTHTHRRRGMPTLRPDQMSDIQT